MIEEEVEKLRRSEVKEDKEKSCPQIAQITQTCPPQEWVDWVFPMNQSTIRPINHITHLLTFFFYNLRKSA
jgi:ribosomal protein S2